MLFTSISFFIASYFFIRLSLTILIIELTRARSFSSSLAEGGENLLRELT